MANSINTNIAAYSAQGNIGRASNSASASIARLSSGNRITKASDDVAALSIGTSLRTGVTTLKTALTNASQGSSLLQVADGALSQISEILQRQKAIATQAGSGSLGSTERGFLNQEFQNLSLEIDRIAATTNFNGVTLLNGGLGNKTTLAQYDATAGAFDPTTNGGVSAVSTYAIEAFSTEDGSALSGLAAAGEALVVDGPDSGTAAALADTAYNSVNQAVLGKFTDFTFSNVVYGTGTGSATLTAKIGGVSFTATILDGDDTAVLQNGSTYVQIQFTAADFTDDSSTAVTQQNLAVDFEDTAFMRTSTIQGVNFQGTALKGVTGLAASGGIGMIRLSDSRADISDFRYVTTDGTDSTLAVTVNGKTFTATGVADTVTDGTIIVFDDGEGQALQIDLTGLETDITDIRTNMTDRTNFLNALNLGFSRTGSGLNFQVGSTSSDSLRISLGAASTVSLFNGQTLDVATAAGSANAVTALDIAIQKVTSLRADVGAAQSRFNFASANLETSIQNQDAARGALLDTDVAAESTAYATSQVQLQAGIAVLAQANQLPQNLLKLIS